MTIPLEKLLREVEQFIRPPKERTLFSLGGRGYYENPASDLLAFFLNPDAEHDLKSLFLVALLDCMKVDWAGLSFKGCTVHREIKTHEGNRIDLLVRGPDWVLIIENKIYHIQANPFDSYEAYAQSLSKQASFAILSPDGQSTRSAWRGVSYKLYCKTLRSKLGEAMFETKYSKWQLFAREFILHLENELYDPAMTPEQAAFVEQHAEQIAEVQKLASQYREFLRNRLTRHLEEKIPGHTFRTEDHGWAIRCYSDKWGRSNIAFSREADRKFYVTIYLIGLTGTQSSSAHQKLASMRAWTEGAWTAWRTEAGLDSREEAIGELCEIAEIVAALLRAPPDPTLPPPPPGAPA